MPARQERPLSPHLQVYRPQLTTVMSIFHRFCGAALAAGTLMVVWMLLAAASGPGAFGAFTAFCASPLGLLMLLGWSFALFYHMCNGVRHLFWDTGRLFEIGAAYRAGYAAFLAALILTGVTWYFVFTGWTLEGFRFPGM